MPSLQKEATVLWITHLFPLGDPAAGDDDDLVLLVKGHNLSHTVGGTRVVDVTEQRSKF